MRRPSLSFRLGKESDIPLLSGLERSISGATVSDSYWDWKYYKNPAGHALFVLALTGERVIGRLAVIPARFSVGGQEIIGAQEVDVTVAEDFRRLDVLLSMINLEREILSQEGIGFTYGFTVDSTSTIAQTLMGKTKIGAVARLVKILNVRPHIENRLSFGFLSGIISLPINFVLKAIYPQKFETPSRKQIRKITRFDSRFDDLWQRVKNDHNIIVTRNSTYLNWRYVRAVHRTYEIFCIEDESTGAVEGFIVFGLKKDKFLIGEIFEILSLKTEDDVIARSLLGVALEKMRQKKAAVVRCWMFEHSHIFPELTRAGFIQRKKKGRDIMFRNFAVHSKAISDVFVKEVGNWYITKGDSDDEYRS